MSLRGFLFVQVCRLLCNFPCNTFSERMLHIGVRLSGLRAMLR